MAKASGGFHALIPETDVCLSSHFTSENLDDFIKQGRLNIYGTEDGECFFSVIGILNLLDQEEEEDDHKKPLSDSLDEDDYFDPSDFDI